MLVGFYVLKGDGSAVYSPSFPRGGLAANFSTQILQLVGSPTGLALAVEHKNYEDTGFPNAGNFAAITAQGVAVKDITGLKEEVRFSYTVSATNAWEGCYLLMAAPAWRPY